MAENNHVKIDDSAYVRSNQSESSSNVDINQLFSRYQVTDKELSLVKNTLKPVMTEKIPEMITEFYKWMVELPEYGHFFGGNKEMLSRVQKAQEIYWHELLEANLDDVFIQKRMRLAQTHSRINLPLDSYFAALAFFTNWVMDLVNEQSKEAENEQLYNALAAFVKIQQIDMAIVVNEYNERKGSEKNELIQRQAITITKLATPIAVLAEDILLVSIIGVIDSKRAQDVLETTLTKVLETTSKVTIIDIAGVDMVDTAVANHLIKMTKAIKLMGCSCILSGVSPAIALTVVQLGIDLKELNTKAVLRDAVESAYEIVNEKNSRS